MFGIPIIVAFILAGRRGSAAAAAGCCVTST
jgi:hypothetical protein